MKAAAEILPVGVASLLLHVSSGACPEPVWRTGYSCQVEGTCSCKDNAHFVDMWGYSCIDWNSNCIGAADNFEYPPEEEINVIENCPKACGICNCGDWVGCFSNETAIMEDTQHFRDLPKRSFCLNGCAEPMWHKGYTCEVEGTCNCTDNAYFVDEYGYRCIRWKNDCIEAAAKYGYSLQEEKTILSNCPQACGVCSCGWPECSGEESGPVITAGPGGWFSADLINNLFAMFLQEILGYSVRQGSEESSDYRLEVWAYDFHRYSEANFEAFDLGYTVREGIYFAGIRYETCYQHEPNCTDKCSSSDITAGQCANRLEAFEIFSRHMAPSARTHFPAIGYFGTLWGGDATEKETFIPEHCLSAGSATCMELLSYEGEDPRADRLHTLISATFFPYHVLKVGLQRTREGVEHRISSGKGVVFSFWEPDPFLVRMRAFPVAFPYKLSSCSNPEEGYGDAIGCSKPNQEIKNFVNNSLALKAPEAYYALHTSFRVSEVDLKEMMAAHVFGGGELDDLNHVSCFWMKRNQDKVRNWLPPCLPGASPYIDLNNSWSCCNGTFLRHPSGRRSCKPACNISNQVPDAVTGSCWPRCSIGTVLNRTPSSPVCESCSEGMVWMQVSDPFFTGKVAECQCPAGRFSKFTQADKRAGNTAPSCQQCPLGKYQDTLGRSACIACSEGFFANTVGRTGCLRCPVGKYADSVGSSGCHQCPPKHTSTVEGSITADNCKCKAGDYFDSSIRQCKSCGLLLTTANMGAESSDQCVMNKDVQRAIGFGAGGLISFLVLLAMLFRYYSAKKLKQIQKWENKQEEHYNEIIEKAYNCMKCLEYPMVLIRSDIFMELGHLESYEILRDEGKLIFLDSLQSIREFKEQFFIIFLSHQWLGWGKPDPENVQYDTMCTAIRNVSDLYDYGEKDPLTHWYVWCDFISVPQAMRKLQILAITSLSIYACVAHAFVIIAPTCEHSGSGKTCNLDTYTMRGWCRTEILAKLCGSGVRHMYVVSDACGQVERVTHEFLDRLDFRVFHGDFSCCHLSHRGSEKCDKEDLVVVVLGLYALVLSQQHKPHISSVLQRINMCKMDCFPKAFTFVQADGSEEERELFGPTITMLEDQIATTPGEVSETPFMLEVSHSTTESMGIRRGMSSILNSMDAKPAVLSRNTSKAGKVTTCDEQDEAEPQGMHLPAGLLRL